MIILSIGGNLGDVEATFARALTMLEQGGFVVTKVSSPYRNPAVGCEEGAPEFVNWAVVGEWSGTPLELLDLAQSIEVAEGRPADHPHWHSRTLDIDIIECNGVVCDTPRLTLPHPRWRERDFVCVPLREIAPEWLNKFHK
jgi:2-amino-4-hydroxy-6-hydroxymethyldihydropteridine diphosphokinase